MQINFRFSNCDCFSYHQRYYLFLPRTANHCCIIRVSIIQTNGTSGFEIFGCVEKVGHKSWKCLLSSSHYFSGHETGI
ncbi:unnamed protein product [Musa acuminata subsp. malaccensis]|uniref:(wild Malaysian banana) hypothetical protein n=1 Tax=Musa acuminata subsp. malaccensis TaxID=214687 RepID=A0A804J441_MUSAM|nr:unnamed protein product [Musa acuminata subsp. malaccensis]